MKNFLIGLLVCLAVSCLAWAVIGGIVALIVSLAAKYGPGAGVLAAIVIVPALVVAGATGGTIGENTREWFPNKGWRS